jgi:hypothetical protein
MQILGGYQLFSQAAKQKVVTCVQLLLISMGLIIGALSLFYPIRAANSPQDAERKIVSDDFTKNRKKATTESAAKTSTETASTSTRSKIKEPRIYRPAASSTARPKHVSSAKAIAQLGVTIWRLRPATTRDTGARMLVREKGASSDWIPERVEAGTSFQEGDHIRVSVESRTDGYLYIINRDLLANDVMGDAMLIFPWAGVDNEMRPGKLIDIPAQDDDPNHFTARLTSQNQIGELLTIILTKSPLALPIPTKPIRVSAVDLAEWEKRWGGQSEQFELEGGAGQPWTEQEQQAAAKKGSRQLTRDDPAPQTIYRIPVKDKTAFLVNVRLNYGK